MAAVTAPPPDAVWRGIGAPEHTPCALDYIEHFAYPQRLVLRAPPGLTMSGVVIAESLTTLHTHQVRQVRPFLLLLGCNRLPVSALTGISASRRRSYGSSSACVNA